MFEFFSYESVRRANEERLTRSLRRYELLRRASYADAMPALEGAAVVELLFVAECPVGDQLSA